MDDFLRFACPACGKRLKAKPRQAGTRADCPCGHTMMVPKLQLEHGQESARHEPSRIRWPWFAAVAAMLVLVVGWGAWLLTRGRNQSVIPAQSPATEVAAASTSPTKPASQPPQEPGRAVASDAEKSRQPEKPPVKEVEQAVAPKPDTPKEPEKPPTTIADFRSLAEVKGNFTTAIIRSHLKQDKPGIMAFRGSTLWMEMAEQGQNQPILAKVLLDEPGSILFVAEDGVSGGDWKRDPEALKSATGVFFLGNSTVGNWEFYPVRTNKAEPQGLSEGRVYVVSTQQQPQLTEEDLYSVWISFDKEQLVHENRDDTSRVLLKLSAGDKVQLLLVGKEPAAWHKVRINDPTSVDGWLRGDRWTKAFFMRKPAEIADGKAREGSDAGEKWPFSTPIPKGYAFKGLQIRETRELIPGIQPLPKYRVFILRSEEIGNTRRTLLVIRPADSGKEIGKEIPLHMDFPRWAAEISVGLSPDAGFEKNSLTIHVPPKRSDNFHVLNFDVEAEREGREYPKTHAAMIISSNYSTPYLVVGAGLATEAEARITADSVNRLTDALKAELGVVVDEGPSASDRDKPQVAEESKPDEERLQGTWVPTSISIDALGFSGFSGEAAQKLMRWIVGGDTVTIKGEGKNGGLTYQIAWKQDRFGLFALDRAKELKFILDSSKKPGTIDIKQGNTTVPGIYLLENGQLTVCLDLSGRKRPDEFEVKKGTTHALFVLRRDK